MKPYRVEDNVIYVQFNRHPAIGTHEERSEIKTMQQVLESMQRVNARMKELRRELDIGEYSCNQ